MSAEAVAKADFLGLTAEGWIAAGTFGLFLATAVLAGVTVFLVRTARDEIREVRSEARKNRTIEMVGRYDHDPILDQALRRMARARDTGELYTDPHGHRMDIIAVLNYLETLAVGVSQGIYLEEMVRDHMEEIIRDHLQEAVEHKFLEKIGCGREGFGHIFALSTGWVQKEQPTTRYRDGALK